MITLDFIIKPEVVVFHLLNTFSSNYSLPGAPTAESKILMAKARKLDARICTFLNEEVSATSFATAIVSREFSLTEIGNRIDKLVEALLPEPFTAEILKQTAQALADVRKEWEHNYFKSNELLSELTGLKLDRQFKIYMTHPATRQGFNDLRGNIFWTYRLDFPNYNTVYLWHEIMHYYIDREHKYSGQVSHSIVELLTDQELRVCLNVGTDFASRKQESYLPLQGHHFLADTEKQLLPSWLVYINQKGKKNINEYIVQADKLLQDDHKNRD